MTVCWMRMRKTDRLLLDEAPHFRAENCHQDCKQLCPVLFQPQGLGSEKRP